MQIEPVVYTGPGAGGSAAQAAGMRPRCDSGSGRQRGQDGCEQRGDEDGAGGRRLQPLSRRGGQGPGDHGLGPGPAFLSSSVTPGRRPTHGGGTRPRPTRIAGAPNRAVDGPGAGGGITSGGGTARGRDGRGGPAVRRPRGGRRWDRLTGGPPSGSPSVPRAARRSARMVPKAPGRPRTAGPRRARRARSGRPAPRPGPAPRLSRDDPSAPDSLRRRCPDARSRHGPPAGRRRPPGGRSALGRQSAPSWADEAPWPLRVRPAGLAEPRPRDWVNRGREQNYDGFGRKASMGSTRVRWGGSAPSRFTAGLPGRSR